MAFEQYLRTAIAEMRPVTENDITHFKTNGVLFCSLSEEGKATKKVSISDFDLENGSPKIGDRIARNPESHDDQWLVAEEYFKNNFIKK